MKMRGSRRSFGFGGDTVEIIAKHQPDWRDAHRGAVSQRPAGEERSGQPAPIVTGDHCLNHRCPSAPLSIAPARLLVASERRGERSSRISPHAMSVSAHADRHLGVVGVVPRLLWDKFHEGGGRSHLKNYVGGHALIRRAGRITHCRADQAAVKAIS